MKTRSAPRTSRRKSCTRATRGVFGRAGMRGESMPSTVPGMRIAVDGRHLAAGRGVARYSRSLLDELRTAHPADEWDVAPDAGRLRNASSALFGRPALGRGADVAWLPAPAPAAV